jgi:iron uptake system component EfeO
MIHRVCVLSIGVALFAAGCGSTDRGSTVGSGAIQVESSDRACSVSATEVAAGPHVFTVTNTGGATTEFYIYGEGDRVVGEVENVGPALSRELTVTLEAGSYQLACKPGMTGKGIRSTLTVTDSTAARATVGAADSRLGDAVQQYRRYVQSETRALVGKVAPFAAAVKSGDISKAKSLFATSRVHWERIEPVAESFGDLDPKVDARENDVEPGQKWTGFHAIEKMLWVDRDVSKAGPLADQLLADVKTLDGRVKTVRLTPDSLSNGAKELMDEVANGKITGEEDRYSHTDLYDFQGNLEGSLRAYTALRPVVRERDPKLASALDARFASVSDALAQHVEGDGFRLYNDLSKAEIKVLATAVDALIEPLSKLTTVVVQS